MHQELTQLIIALMSSKKDNAMAPIVGSSSIVEPGSMANVALDVAPSIEVEHCANLHMREVFESPPHSPQDLLQSFPTHLLTQTLKEIPLNHSQVPLLLRFLIQCQK